MIHPKGFTRRTDIINIVADKIGAKSYLEIGVRNPDDNFNRIKVPIDRKVGVDPAAKKRFQGEFKATSDEFFKVCKGMKQRFDLVFVDGLHTYDQCKMDILNALDVLNDGGAICVHDVNPCKRCFQVDKVNGKCWIVIAELRMTRPDLWIATVPDDDGVAIIRRGKQELYQNRRIRWPLFVTDRKRLMNFISVQELKNTAF